jgi:hypothetical protein
LRHVTENDEWCAEAYLEPDFSEISKDGLHQFMREYVLQAFKLKAEIATSNEVEE